MQPVVFISGATSGIGLATARHMVTKKWHVIGSGLPGDDFAPLREIGADTVELDLADDASIATTADFIERRLGVADLSGLVNNAGIQVAGVLQNIAITDLRRQFDVNVIGHLALTQRLVPSLRRANGRIVNVSSMMGRIPLPTLGAYSMSKHALEAMTDVLRFELSPWQIRVIAIQAGAIATPMTDGMTDLYENLHTRETDQYYRTLYQKMQKAFKQQSFQVILPQDVADIIAKALSDPNPRTRYHTDMSSRASMGFKRLMTDGFFDNILRRAFNLRDWDT